jgi:4-aminobutyrate aminotransferase
LVVSRAAGAMLEDVDGNIFLEFNAGVAVCSTGHSHPLVVEKIKKQVDEFIHISSTDYYYSSMPKLASELGRMTPGNFERREPISATQERKP